MHVTQKVNIKTKGFNMSTFTFLCGVITKLPSEHFKITKYLRHEYRFKGSVFIFNIDVRLRMVNLPTLLIVVSFLNS